MCYSWVQPPPVRVKPPFSLINSGPSPLLFLLQPPFAFPPSLVFHTASRLSPLPWRDSAVSVAPPRFACRRTACGVACVAAGRLGAMMLVGESLESRVERGKSIAQRFEGRCVRSLLSYAIEVTISLARLLT